MERYDLEFEKLYSELKTIKTENLELKECNVELMQEIDMLKKQLKYLRSGEYYNQLRFERDMLQDLVDKGEISKEDKEFIDCTHRNTELLEELEEEKRINVEDLKTIDRQQEIIQELREKLDKYENPEDMTLMMMWATEKVKDENKQLKEKIDKVTKEINRINNIDVNDYYETLVCKELAIDNLIEELESGDSDVEYK